jgi:hypothetical protein
MLLIYRWARQTSLPSQMEIYKTKMYICHFKINIVHPLQKFSCLMNCKNFYDLSVNKISLSIIYFFQERVMQQLYNNNCLRYAEVKT